MSQYFKSSKDQGDDNNPKLESEKRLRNFERQLEALKN